MEKTDDLEMLAVEILNLGSKTRMLVNGTHWKNCERHRKDGNAPLI
jgi:hypothetical protein